MVGRGAALTMSGFHITREKGAVVTISRRRAIMIMVKEAAKTGIATLEKKWLMVKKAAKVKKKMQDTKDTIKNAAKLKKARVTETTDDEYTELLKKANLRPSEVVFREGGLRPSEELFVLRLSVKIFRNDM